MKKNNTYHIITIHIILYLVISYVWLLLFAFISFQNLNRAENLIFESAKFLDVKCHTLPNLVFNRVLNCIEFPSIFCSWITFSSTQGDYQVSCQEVLMITHNSLLFYLSVLVLFFHAMIQEYSIFFFFAVLCFLLH